MINIVLVEPQIPQNTGNIGRLCVAGDARLHLIYPLGFSTDEKALRRAGMDYWQKLEVREYENLAHFWESHPMDARHFLLSTKAEQVYYDARFCEECYLYFGREDRGLDASLLTAYASQVYKIPMHGDTRSINLATSVGAVLYEAIRQSGSYLRF